MFDVLAQLSQRDRKFYTINNISKYEETEMFPSLYNTFTLPQEDLNPGPTEPGYVLPLQIV